MFDLIDPAAERTPAQNVSPFEVLQPGDGRGRRDPENSGWLRRLAAGSGAIENATRALHKADDVVSRHFQQRRQSRQFSDWRELEDRAPARANESAIGWDANT